MLAMRDDEETKASPRQIAYVGSLTRSQGEESGENWFTPEPLLRSIERSIGGIALDPFSCAAANVGVRAARYFDRESNGLTQSWAVSSRVGGIFCNPPYSRGLCGRACNKWLEQWDARAFNRGIMLTNNATETVWFQAMLAECTAVCLFKGRIAFLTPDAKRASGNTRGQALFLFARSARWVTAFRREMNPLGLVLLNG